MSSCRQTLLARGATAQLTRCSCGHLHLALGPVTLRLEEGALRDVLGTVGEGLAALELGAEVPAGDALPGRGGWAQ